MRGRKNGCPTNIRDWQISILDKGWTAQERWVRIRGLRVMSKTCDSETADSINVLIEDETDDYSDYQPW